MPPRRIPPKAGQESVWDYPRPPKLEPTTRHLRVAFAGVTVAETRRALRVLETSHPPVYYFPPEDVRLDLLERTARSTLCEFKGRAVYWTLHAGGRRSESAAWSYPHPAPGYEALKDYLAFYPSRVESCWVDGERVTAQAGDFYGGWITGDIVGPFKGGPGTWGW
ncbi:DUF427 domain-containing protein [Truepera radiovictrix]|uniref:DUF427 domain-containing protein n=1 Tax=Truepera radiovictrix (strain DSM 17093 / CIP 108686 / LMG 22925 / RQ-24) TaxID=649638 RepID=D7CWM3_TRURR|nr:DUF427 domain-containing protein [Truepera radiovictrix]ADI14422.1 protein of unknown function DUF427 [Truepera radiovictrix DSM 17093]WMT57021.1 DUF427 domain-containing protein [Truepera radiovictrix]